MSRNRALAALAVAAWAVLALSAGQAAAQSGASISGFAWYDANYDGVRNEDALAGLANVTVKLAGAGADGSFGSPDDVNYPAQVTGPDGAYTFPGLPAGRYRVLVDQTPPSLSWTTPQPTIDVTLSADQAMTGVDFGFALIAGGGVLGDKVWYDGNANSVYDTGEQGIDGVTVTLAGDLDGDGLAEITRTTTTRTLVEESGIYAFDLLPLGKYQVAVEPRTIPSNLLPAYDFDGITTPHGVTLPLQGDVNVDVDFGYKRCGVETGNLTAKSKKAKWKIANRGDSILTVARVSLTWPAEAGRILRIRLGGRTLFSGSGSGSLVVEGPWPETLDDRQLAAGRQKELKVEFENDLGKSTRGYGVRIEFAEGCAIEYNGTRTGIYYCDGRRPAQLTMLYTGESCLASDNLQATDKATCADSLLLPPATTSVYVRASDRVSPTDSRARVWFEGVLDLHTAALFDAALARESRLQSTTYVHVFENLQGVRGAAIQQLSFKTDCSQPLVEGDQFGGLVLIGFMPE